MLRLRLTLRLRLRLTLRLRLRLTLRARETRPPDAYAGCNTYFLLRHCSQTPMDMTFPVP